MAETRQVIEKVKIKGQHQPAVGKEEPELQGDLLAERITGSSMGDM